MTPDAAAPPRRGRRTGKPDTRKQIMDAAWTLFLRDGFSATSMRAVARAAGCDPALVHHYFSSKEQLFFDALHVAINADRAIQFLTEPGLGGLGRRLFAILTAVYDSPHGAELVSTLVRDAETRSLFVAVIGERIEQAVAQLIPLGRSHRARLIAQTEAVLAGFVTTRYLLATQHAASLSRSEAIAVYGDLLQAAIDQVALGRAHGPGPSRPD